MRGAGGFPLPFLLCAWLAAACGGDGPAAPPTPPPSPVSTNPCTAALAATTAAGAPRTAGKTVGPDLHGRWRALDALWLHEAAGRRGWLTALATPPRAQDAGEIAVLQDEGDLVAPPNPFDLTGRGLRFSPNGADGYDVSAVDGTFRQMLGDRLSLGDDDGTESGLAFGFDKPETTTVQIALLPDASVEVKYGTSIGLGEAVVGLSPGRTASFSPVDLSAAGSSGAAGAALGERFARFNQLDIVALSRKFYATHGDLYDLATDYGSAGRMRSLVMMDVLSKYPADPSQRFLGENSTLSLMGQEAGHRWLAFLRFLDHDRQVSDALLGRDQAHWSFFLDSDASVMEGNDIEALGGGAFRTVAAVERFSLLDQYAMGLVGESEVPPFFYVQSPVNVTGNLEATSAPRVGVTFNGTRRDVLIQDVVAVMGPRVPSAAESPRVHRQAFLYIAGADRSADAAAIDKIDRIRRAWETFFLTATGGRMRLDSRLNQ